MTSLSPTLVISLVALAATVAIALVVVAVVRGRRPGRAGAGDPGRASDHGGPSRTERRAPVAVGPGRGAPPTSSRVQERAGQLRDVAPRPLEPDDRERYLAAWRGVQAIFVDDPRRAIVDADQLVENVLRTRGYRLADPAARAPGDEGEPEVVRRFWAGHDITVRRADPNVEAKDLWAAMAEYQAAIDALTAAPESVPGARPAKTTAQARG